MSTPLDLCSICREDIKDDEPRGACDNPDCEHVFHEDCLDQWLAINPSCPLCKSEISSPIPVIQGHLSSQSLLEEKQREREIANLNVRPTPPTPQTQITGGVKPENVAMDCKKYCYGCTPEDMLLGFRCKKCEGTEGGILTEGIPPNKGYCIGDGENGVCYNYNHILTWVRARGRNPKTRRRLTTTQIRDQWAKGNKCKDSKSSREEQAQHRLWQSQLDAEDQLAHQPVSSSSSAQRWSLFQEGPGPNRKYSGPAVIQRLQERRRIKEQKEELNSIKKQRKKENKARKKEREPFFESKESPAFCRKCGEKDPLSTMFDHLCKNCRFDQRILMVPPKFCPRCGDPNGEYYCSECGTDYSATYKRRRKG